MNIEHIIQKAFPEAVIQNTLTDTEITRNDNLMEIEDNIDLLLYIPVYMLWCVKNKDNCNQLVTDYTIRSLAEFGRSKDQNNNKMNFKYRCNFEQKLAVKTFLQWCQKNLLIFYEPQVERAIKHWESVCDSQSIASKRA